MWNFPIKVHEAKMVYLISDSIMVGLYKYVPSPGLLVLKSDCPRIN